MEYITITVGEERITSKQTIKYLGVMIYQVLGSYDRLELPTQERTAKMVKGAAVQGQQCKGSIRDKDERQLQAFATSSDVNTNLLLGELMEKI